MNGKDTGRKGISGKLLAALFWIAVWLLSALAVGKELILPGPVSVLRALGRLVVRGSFWASILLTMFRIMLGYILGVSAGCLLALACCSSKTMDTLFDKVQKKNLFTEKLQLIPFDEVWDAFATVIQNSENYDNTLEGPNYAYHVAIFPKYDIDNVTCIGATGFFRDISEELKLERTRKDYVANISHELRTPLQTLRGLIEPLSDGMVKKEEDRMRYYGIILHETMRLSRLIDDMQKDGLFEALHH